MLKGLVLFGLLFFSYSCKLVSSDDNCKSGMIVLEMQKLAERMDNQMNQVISALLQLEIKIGKMDQISDAESRMGIKKNVVEVELNKKKDPGNENLKKGTRVTRSAGQNYLQIQLDHLKNEQTNFRQDTENNIQEVETNIKELKTWAENLNSILSSNFQNISGKIDSVDLKASKVEANINELKTQIEGSNSLVSSNFQNISEKIDSVVLKASKLEMIEKNVDACSSQIGINGDRLTNLLDQLPEMIKRMDRNKKDEENKSKEVTSTLKELEKKIGKMEQNFAEAICSPMGINNEGENRMKQIIEKQSGVGKFMSLLESNKSREDQVGGCGGILVGDKGFISFQPNLLRANTEFTCIWTIRSNLFEQVAIKLIEGDLGSNTTLFVTPLKVYIFNNASVECCGYSTSKTKTISSTKEVYKVDGPVVFLTLVANTSSLLFPKFQVYYEGLGGNADSSKQYRHYHFGESKGELDYPKIRGAETYSSNEVATFVINPHPPSLLMDLKKVDLETSNGCAQDALTFLYLYKSTLPYYYSVLGHFKYKQDWRYCMTNTSLTDGKFNFALPHTAFILTFTSDASTEHTGFKIFWNEK